MKRVFTVLLAALLLSSALSAAPYYDIGDQFLTITAGPTTPVYYYNNEDQSSVIGPGSGDGRISEGGIVSIGYEVFVTNYLAVGGELGYQFNFSRNGNVVTSVPIHAKLTFLPIQGQFELPISFSIGANYVAYEDLAQITFSATVSIGFNYFFDRHWGIGINAGLSVLPELYTDSTKNSVRLDVPTTISAIYRH